MTGGHGHGTVEGGATWTHGAPADGDAALTEATRARAAGDWERVLRHADVAAAAGADGAATTELRALALTRLRRLDEAEAAFAALLGTPAYRTRGETGLGVIALERGDGATARAWLERATAGGAGADAWAALGLCLTTLGEPADAWRAYVEARTREPGDRTALAGLITLASALDRLADLEVHLREYLARVGDDADVRYALASCLFAAGRREASRAAVAEVLRRAPGHALATALARELGG